MKEQVNKMRLSAVVRLSMKFQMDDRDDRVDEKLEIVMRHLTLMTTWCLISTLELPWCDMNGQEATWILGVLAQCPALALDLNRN